MLGGPPQPTVPARPLPLLWRDPHSVPKEQLSAYIEHLELACRENPRSASLRTCLGMARAMNFEVYKSMDALEAARRLDPEHFWAQMKYSELLYRLRALPRAEQETITALNLASNDWELFTARQQLQEIRRLIRDGTQKPEWNRPLLPPAILLVVLFAVLSYVAVHS
ncbi:MAG: hypothetical protein HYX27_05220 [Acidobacteria bacterium]|nr:hypothetical protein [Acidobacteriota bacterium]